MSKRLALGVRGDYRGVREELFMRLLAKRLSISVLLLSGIGCGGGGGNNDNGVGVALLGFTAVDNGVCTGSTFVSAVAMPISGGASAESPDANAGIPSCFQVRNNLVTQAVRLDRANLRYYIPGSSLQPPATVYPVVAFLAAATGNTSLPNPETSGKPGTKPESTLPSGNVGSVAGNPPVTGAFAAVPVAIREWISAHRGDLPPAPFNMLNQVQLSGVTSAGNRIETNEAVLTIIVKEDNLF